MERISKNILVAARDKKITVLIEPNEERLLSYAVDLGMEVNPVLASDNGRITTVKVVKGILYSTTKLRKTKTYTIVNRNDAERLVLVEHPVRNEFHLTDDVSKPARQRVRFGSGRQDRDTGGNRRTRHRIAGATDQQQRRSDTHLHQQHGQQPGGQRRTEAGNRLSLGLEQDATSRRVSSPPQSPATAPTLFGRTITSSLCSKPVPPDLEMHIYGNGGHGVGLTDRGGIPFGMWTARFIDWFKDLGFLGKPGTPTEAADNVEAYAEKSAK